MASPQVLESDETRGIGRAPSLVAWFVCSFAALIGLAWPSIWSFFLPLSILGIGISMVFLFRPHKSEGRLLRTLLLISTIASCIVVSIQVTWLFMVSQ